MKTWQWLALGGAAAFFLLRRGGGASASGAGAGALNITSGKDFFQLAQGDPRWASMLVGFSTKPESSMANVGCFFTSLVATRNMLLGGSMLPPEAMQLAKRAEAFQNDLLILSTAARALGVSAPESERIRANEEPVEKLRAKADDILRRNGIVIFNVGYNSTAPRHFIICNRRSANGYECMDVAGTKAHFMTLDPTSLQGQRTASKRYITVGVAGVFRK